MEQEQHYEISPTCCVWGDFVDLYNNLLQKGFSNFLMAKTPKTDDFLIRDSLPKDNNRLL